MHIIWLIMTGALGVWFGLILWVSNKLPEEEVASLLKIWYAGLVCYIAVTLML